jgi:hypothetical protein
MKCLIRSLVCGLVVAAIASTVRTSQAAIIQFDLQGQDGAGLLPGNQIGLTTGGTGGELGGGITFDDVTKILSINVGWGSGNGFVDLSGVATASHLHGPADQSSNAGVMYSLTRVDSSANLGSINTSFAISAADETHLLAGNSYINIHTAVNPGGEVRGNLMAIPEPSTLILLVGAGGGLVICRRKLRR